MIKKKIIIGNWKMNPSTQKEADKLFLTVAKSIAGVKKTDIVICPPFVYLANLKKFSRKIFLGAQDAFWADTGPFTGEISSEMLYNLGAQYVVLGHSERRELGETSADVNKKIKSALSSGLVPILCVGEKNRDADHEYFNIVREQVEESLKGVSKLSVAKIIVAYEPVWALSSTPDRRDAPPADSREMVVFIRKILSDKFGSEAIKMRIIYGGSANEKDAEDFLKDGGVDGLLPGKASLDAKKFVEIIKIAENFAK